MKVKTKSEAPAAFANLSDFPPPSELEGGWSEFHETLKAANVTAHRYGVGRAPNLRLRVTLLHPREL